MLIRAPSVGTLAEIAAITSSRSAGTLDRPHARHDATKFGCDFSLRKPTKFGTTAILVSCESSREIRDRGAKQRRASYVQGSAGYEVAAAERYLINAGVSLEETVECRPDLADAASFMVGSIKDLSRCGVRATMKTLRTAWANRVPTFDTFFTQGLFSMAKLMDAACLTVAESGRKLKKIKTMQELWEAGPDLKEASLFMVNLVKEYPKMTKVMLHNTWDNLRGVCPETSGDHMESKSLFSHGYLSMKILKEYANGGNRKASSNSSDANATAAAAAEIHVGGGGGTFAEVGGRGGVSSGWGRAAADAANANTAAAPAAAAAATTDPAAANQPGGFELTGLEVADPVTVLAAADAWTDTTILDAILNRDPPFTRHDCSVEVLSVGMEGTSRMRTQSWILVPWICNAIVDVERSMRFFPPLPEVCLAGSSGAAFASAEAVDAVHT
jgi:hypothetical protein